MPGRSRTVSLPPTANFGFSVQISAAGPAGKNSTINVESELARFRLPGTVLVSSGRRAPLISGGALAARRSVVDR
jgi:hypothetical protein